MSGLKSRVQKLESNAGQQEPEDSPWWYDNDILQGLHTSHLELFNSLEGEHRAIVDKDLDRLHLWWSLHRDAAVPIISPLTKGYLHLLGLITTGHYAGPIVLTADVARAYLEAADASAFWHCVKCNYPMPGHSEDKRQAAFETCPACRGNKIIYSAFRATLSTLPPLSHLEDNARLNILLDSMQEDYKAVVLSELERLNEYYSTPDCQDDISPPLHILFEAARCIVYPHPSAYLVPIRLPPEVAEAWIQHGII